MKTVEFIYRETQIHFLVNPSLENVMVNATEMAKPFGKEPKDFLRLEGTKRFINHQLKKENIVADVPRYIAENIYFSKNKLGTFMARKLALKFAAWLDVEFEDWIFDTIDELIFGNYKKHYENPIRQKQLEMEINELKSQMLAAPTPELVASYFAKLEEMHQCVNIKRKAIKDQNQLDLFNNQ